VHWAIGAAEADGAAAAETQIANVTAIDGNAGRSLRAPAASDGRRLIGSAPPGGTNPPLRRKLA
jgi:hypothetical protein